MKTRKKLVTIFRRIGLLLWKNILFRRKPLMIVLTILEITFPTLLIGGIAWYSTIVENDTGVTETNFTYFSTYPEEDLMRPAKRKLNMKNTLFAYYPENPLTTEIMEIVKKRIGTRAVLRAFESEKELEEYVEDSEIPLADYKKRKEKIGAAVIFGPAFQVPNETLYQYKLLNPDELRLNYTIRIPIYTIYTNYLVGSLQLPGPQHDNAQSYRGAGVTGLQIAIDKTIINFVTGEEPSAGISQEVFPYPAYDTTKFNTIFFIPMPAAMVLSFIFIVPTIMRNVVSERQTGIKELMKIMGLPNWMHWFGWMINSLTVLVFSITIVIALLFYPFNEAHGAIVSIGDYTLWWVVMLLYTMAATAFCFFISVFTTNPVMATTTGVVLWLLSYFLVGLPIALDYENLTLVKKLVSSILPNTALHWAIGVMATLEGKGIGAQWSNLAQPGSTLDGVSLLHIIAMFIFDIFFYVCMSMYFENVLPSKYGIRKPWYYPLLPSTWFNVSKKPSHNHAKSSWDNPIEKPGFESEPVGLTPGITVNNLTKVYGKKTAVNGVSLKMYHGQITALVGHNGAGKTTTMSILTGLFPPTTGTASVNGFDIRTELDRVRENLGLCPQHNMLFDDLTVLEHLQFFGRLKGLTSHEAHYEAVNLIKKLQLKSKKYVAASSLSGGQKRKLSLGIALIGGSKVVILDEPTSGMDPEARRAIWDLLLELKNERSICLVTHFMEEADILGDRIAVMARGQVQCCGTPLYLKKFFGAGYVLKLTISRQGEKENRNNVIIQTVKNHVPDAYLIKEERAGENAVELSISIPYNETAGSKLPPMFKDLEVTKEHFGIQTIGLSLSTIEDVFLAIEQNNTKENDPSDSSDSNDNEKMNGHKKKNEPQARFPSIMRQVEGLILKKSMYTFRKRKLLAAQFLMPPVMLAVALLLFNTFYVPRENYPARPITLSSYKNPIVLYNAEDNHVANQFQELVGEGGVRVQDKTLTKALEEASVADLGIYRDHYIVATDFNDTNVHTMYSTIPYHAAPLSINLATNTILRAMSNRSYILDTAFHPLHNLLFSKLEVVKPSRHHYMDGPLMLGLFVPIGLALFASGFLVFPTDERRTQAKQLQLMTGVHPITFWATSFAFDFTLMMLASCIMIAIIPIPFLGLQIFEGTFTNNNALGALLLILMVYGFSAICFSYICSLVFSSVSFGYSISTILHLGTGLVAPLFSFIFDNLLKGGVADEFRYVARLFTTYGVSVSVMRFSSISILNSRCAMLTDVELDIICNPNHQIDANIRQCCPNCEELINHEGIPQCFEPERYFTWNYTLTDEKDFTTYEVPGILQEVLYMIIMGIIYMLIILFMESFSSIRNILTSGNRRFPAARVEDEDVLGEENRVTNLRAKSDDALVVNNLTKLYGSFAAVRSLNFGVHHGECFGLLGVNGAGKTTTFRMLTGDEHPTSGEAFSLSTSLKGSRGEFLKNIGYCPQFDAIIGVLTGREMLKIFCHLRGVPHKDINSQVDKWLRKVGLFKHGDAECRNYSGGMKRRLSVGMAMIGDPPVVFLDEPTSGVDPVSRRQFWEVILSARNLGQSIVLTSHSMEECEALCQRLSIMVNGQLQCLGGVEHLKSKYAKGYTLVFRLQTRGLDHEKIQLLKQEVEQTFTPCVLKDEHQNVLDYQVLNTEMTWDVIFGAMESFKSKYHDLIEDYTVSKTTLEEVFLSFAKLQHMGDRRVALGCGNLFCCLSPSAPAAKGAEMNDIV